MAPSSTIKPLEDKTVLITGGTGSLAKVLVRRLLTGEMGTPKKILLFSRDEGKQHELRMDYMQLKSSTEEIIYNNFNRLIDFRIGDVRSRESLNSVLRISDVVINTAAMKQVPSWEYFPQEAVYTNILGADNLASLVAQHHRHIETVVAISTDKACMPINVMGMCKAIQERILMLGNLHTDTTRFFGVRYGNVLASRGSVIPLFQHQIANGGPVTITHPDMTRFLLSLNEAVDIVFEGFRSARRGEIYIPHIPSAKVTDVAEILIDGRPIETIITGIRPGEKMHELLISEEEARRTIKRNGYYILPSIHPELNTDTYEDYPVLKGAYSSEFSTLDQDAIRTMLEKNGFISPQKQRQTA